MGTAKAARNRLAWRIGEWRKAIVRRAKGQERITDVPVAMACRRAFNTFVPRRSSAPILLIRSAEKQVGEGRDWDFTWDGYTPHLENERIDAGHKTLFQGTAVEAMAELVRRSIGG